MADITSLPHPTAQVSDDKGQMTHEWRDNLEGLIQTLRQRIPITGSATFASSTSFNVVFATPELSANYRVWLSGPENKTFWPTALSTAGFTANVSSASSATIAYQLIRP